MLSYCFKCKSNTDSINPRVSKTSNVSIMLLSKCAVCNSKKSKFVSKQEARRLLSQLGMITHLNNIPLLGDVF